MNFSRENEYISFLGLKIIWMQVSRLPMLHPDRDRWKCTMFY